MFFLPQGWAWQIVNFFADSCPLYTILHCGSVWIDIFCMLYCFLAVPPCFFIQLQALSVSCESVSSTNDLHRTLQHISSIQWALCLIVKALKTPQLAQAPASKYTCLLIIGGQPGQQLQEIQMPIIWCKAEAYYLLKEPSAAKHTALWSQHGLSRQDFKLKNILVTVRCFQAGYPSVNLLQRYGHTWSSVMAWSYQNLKAWLEAKDFWSWYSASQSSWAPVLWVNQLLNS